MPDDPNIPTDPNKQLITLAYSMALEPQRLTDFANLLNARAEALSEGRISDIEPQGISENLSNIAAHFQQALDLIERQGRRFNYATGSMQFIELDIKPSALIRNDGRIIYANSAAINELNFVKKQNIQRELLSNEDYKRLVGDLQKIDIYETDKIISVYNFTKPETGEPIKMALSKAIDYKNNAIGRLSTFHVNWNERRGQQFQIAFGLTPVDIEITRAIILGISLRDVAEKRDRSLSTIRNQTKALFAKLGVHSQVELACLYSGFIHYNLKSPSEIERPKLSNQTRKSVQILQLPDGRDLQYETAGPVSGRPVLYFHGAVDGAITTRAIYKELTSRNIQLITVWRPSFAGSSPVKTARKAPQKFARDIKHLLEHLNIKTCQILSVFQGATYAFACAQYLPEHISGILSCSGVVPIMTHKQMLKIPPLVRVHLVLARHAPILLPMFVRAMVSKIDAGYDEESLMDFFENSPHDLQTLLEPEFRAMMREMYPVYTAQGHMLFVIGAQVEASKWGHLVDGVNCPVNLMHGEENTAYPLSFVREFAKGKPNFTVSPVKQGGQFIYFQYPELIYQALDVQIMSKQ